MLYRLRSGYFLATALLLSTLGCHNTDTIPPHATGSGSYQLNSRQLTGGQTTNRPVSAAAKAVSSSDSGYDYLEVQLNTAPQPASGAEILTLYFSKPVGQPATAYQLDDIVLYGNAQLQSQGSPQRSAFANDVATIAPTEGGFTGTFSGSLSVATGFIQQTDYTLTDGTFSALR